MSVYQFPVFKNGVYTLITADELADTLRPATTPTVPPVVDPPVDPPVVKLFGEPRTYLGTHSEGYPVFSHSAGADLLVLIDEKPDTFARRGTNLPYTAAPGITRPTGLDSPWSGNAEPKGCGRPDANYRIRYFSGKADQPYYERSTAPDEVPTPETPTTNSVPPKPETPQVYDSEGDLGGIFTIN